MTPDPSNLPTAAPGAGPAAPLLGDLGILPGVFAALPTACLLLTPALRIAAVSDAYLALARATREQVLGQDMAAAWPGAPGTPEGEAAASLRASLEQVLATGQAQRLPAQPRATPDPATPGAELTRYWEPTNAPVRDARGTIVGVLHSLVEVAQRAPAQSQPGATPQEMRARHAAPTPQVLPHPQARAESQRQRQRLERLFMQAPAAICILDGPELVYELVNPGYQQLFPGRELLGQPLLAALPELTDQPVWHSLRRVYATGQPHEEKEMRIAVARHAGGALEDFYFNYTQQARFDEHGQVDGVFVFTFDVTEQVRARQRVQELNEALEARVQARTQEAQLARQQAERQRSELQRVFEQAPVAIAVFRGPGYVIELANPTVCALWGRTPAQTLRTPLFELLPEIAGQGFEELLDQVRLTGQPHEAREMPSTIQRHGRLDTVYWDFVYLPTYAAEGPIDGVMVVATEVTAQVEGRRHTEQLNQELEAQVQQRTRQLQAQQGLLSQILGQVPASVATLSGPAHRFSFFNGRYQTLVGGRAALGVPVAEALPEVVAQGFIDLLDGVYATGEAFVGRDISIELFHDPATGQGEQHYLDFVYQPLLDGQGHTQGILAFVVDVTDKVRARQQAERLQADVLAAVQRQKAERENVFQLFEQSPAVICLLREPEHRIDYLNPAYQALFPGVALQGRPLAEIQPAAKGLITLLNSIYKSGKTRFQPQVRLAGGGQGQAPATRYFDFTYQAYREQDRIVGVSIFGLDVTAQVLARGRVQELNEELATINEELQISNEELAATNHQLTRTNADLDTFVYTASHDLKVPIANIEGLLEALNRDLRGQPLGESVPQILGMMQDAVVRFQKTIGYLTDISRLQQEGNAGADTVSLATVIADVLLDLAPLVEATGAQVVVDLDGTPTLPLSPKNLRSIVYNLLSNALKYRHPARPPLVRVQSWQGRGTTLLAVHDNGLGLDERQQHRLFGLFQRLHTHVEGSGVGLYMVRKIAENAGGTVQVRSQAGVGTTFTVTLPQLRERTSPNSA